MIISELTPHITHDAARELLRSPNSEDARAVITRAEALFAERLHDVAMN